MRRFAFTALLCLSLCACREGEHKAYTGKSAHWGQDAVPISLQCAACHAKEFEEWAGSDHAWAWRPLDPALDSEPFHFQKLAAHGSKLSFASNKGRFVLRDEGTGKDFTVCAVLGRTPLVQYMVAGERGAVQCPSAAWDVTRHEWFDLFSDDARLAREGSAERKQGDWGHWLGRGMNWNSPCAWCHMSGFAKNYDAAADSYASTWMEPGVTCIQCHRLADQPDPEDGCMVQRADRVLAPERIHDNCATCHARREELSGAFRAGDRFDDHFRLELPLVEGIFWPNGMQRDEDYCETGLRLSRMGRAGVTCLDCHDPHTATLKLTQEDNALCLRCHASGTAVNGTPAPVIDMATHTPCPATSKGARCVECHMPESPYMARDPRRDHSFNSPDPALSAELGTPNACTMCHAGKSDAWAAEAVARVYGAEPKIAAYRARTRAIDAAMKGRGNAADLLAAYRAEENEAWRAVLMEHMARLEPNAEVQEEARRAATSPNAMLRAAAARVLGTEAAALLAYPVRIVRHAAVWPLLPRLLAESAAPQALAEFEETVRHQSDQPPGAMQLAMLADARAALARSRGDARAAADCAAEVERQYRRAIALDPVSPTPRFDFAVYLAREGKPTAALEQMLACTAANPDNAEAQYRLALILYELGHAEPALLALGKAVDLDPAHLRARSARAELLQAFGRADEAQQERAAILQIQKEQQQQPAP